MDRQRDAYFMRLAFTVATAGKCRRAQYGSVIVSRSGQVLTTAYNGKPAHSINDGECYREGLAPGNTSKPNCCLHSEANALLFSDRLSRAGGTIYVSGIPCQNCTLLIMQSNLARLVYYDLRNPDRECVLAERCPVACNLVYTVDYDRGWEGKRVLRHVVPEETDDLWERYGIDIQRVPFTFEEAG